MTFSRTDVDPRYWDQKRFVRQLVFIAQDGGAGANFLQHLLGKHEGFFQQFDRHIVENNEYISSMPLHDAEHEMQAVTFAYSDANITQQAARYKITDVCLATLNEDEGSKFNQWDRICAQTHCANYQLQHLLDPQHQLLTIVPRSNEDHAFYRTLDVIKQWYHTFRTDDECTFPLRDLDMDTDENRGKCEDWFNEGKLKTLGDMWQLLGIYEDQLDYVKREFQDAHNSMHLYIDNPVCDAYHIKYEDFFINRTKGSYLELCDWLRIHPKKHYYVDMVTDYYDANEELVNQNRDTYDWFLARMNNLRGKHQTYHTELEASVIDVVHNLQTKYEKYNLTSNK